MKFQRQTVRVANALHPRGTTLALKADEVSRHAVRLVVVDRARNAVRVVPFGSLPALLRAGDLVIVNDAATLPASLFGTTVRGETFELRLSAPIAGSRLYGVVLGDGDYHTRTEDRPAPPKIAVGDRLRVATIDVAVEQVAGRRVTLIAALGDDELWQQIYAAGVAVPYAHRTEQLRCTRCRRRTRRGRGRSRCRRPVAH